MLMIRTARRAPLAVAAATSRRAAWWRPLTLSPTRWLTTAPPPTAEEPVAQAAHTRGAQHARYFPLLPAFVETYQASMGHQIVPHGFMVPTIDPAASGAASLDQSIPMCGRESDIRAIPWTAELRGIDLGRALTAFASNTKHQQDYPVVTAALQHMGFPLGDAYRTAKWEQQTKPALKTFRIVHGHMDVPMEFVVPRGDPVWPVVTWGVTLGTRVANLRRYAKSLDAAKLADLERLRLPPGKGNPTWADRAKQLVRKESPQVSDVSSTVAKAVDARPENPDPDVKLRQDRPQSTCTAQEAGCGGNETDESDSKWSQQILPALQVFSEVNSHCRVPPRFVVPSELPWPTDAWAFKLGMCVKNIRVRGYYAVQATRDAAQLAALGFQWDETPTTVAAMEADSAANAQSKLDAEKIAHEFALLPAFVKTFQASAGHLVVPYRFVIPHTGDEKGTSPSSGSGLLCGRVRDPLEIPWADGLQGRNMGRTLRKFATSAKHRRNHPTIARALRDLGFPLGAAYHKLKWERQIMAAFKTFHNLHGHTSVPAGFCVPRGDDAWPAVTWGYELGALVQSLRQDAHTLDAAKLADLVSVDFPIGVTEQTFIDASKQEQANPIAPGSPTIHNDDDLWTPEPWDFNQHVPANQATRFGGLEGDKIESQWSECILPSLEAFFHAKGHCFVSRPFVVPSKSPWPTNAWGFKLGVCVDQIRSRGDYATQATRDAARLTAIDFVWDVDEDNWRKSILPALQAFAATHGHCVVPRSFEVPWDSDWPRPLWGVKLGAYVDAIRSHEYFFAQTERDATQLSAIGFVRSSSDDRWRHRILPALETFYSEYRHCHIASDFVVPSASPWPKEAWGLKLGICAQAIWTRQCFAVQVERDAARLEAIRFVERSSEYTWRHVVLPALQTFAAKYGHCNVPKTFIVPSESPWPEQAWGWNLGTVVKNIRSNFNFHGDAQRDARQLHAIRFAWTNNQYQWMERILPALEVFYELHGHCQVPDTFKIPATSPWPHRSRGLQLGRLLTAIQVEGAYADCVDRDAARLAGIDLTIQRQQRTVRDEHDQDAVTDGEKPE